ncbi:M50 family metallopeptidase [Oceanobacillus chungangensis]|uniref:Stage IV sporulation protein FB n=1 Tax=Oceanobacillus chungangensis TaxID=1229152 RepID=A0A3D8Q2I0_9BACI|nr:M50 family metallopeptidase [Oceanobacillus chungangensis]RDW21669.1 stage IV sporulation protein FB [Oceanobacillus chungangensis]
MTFVNNLPMVKFHPILYVFIAISILTGTFTELAIILSIVLFHELGHFIMANSLGWRVRRIMLWVFGGVMDTDEHGTKPIKEEMLVTLAGPCQHFIVYFLIFSLSPFDLVPASLLELAFYYNSAILLFNLLPIYPLDGGKLLFLLLSAIMPYKQAHQSIILVSMGMAIAIIFLQLFLFPFTLSALFIMVFIFLENRTEWKQRFYTFIRFLLNRYEGTTSVQTIQPIKVSANSTFMDVFAFFKREKKHPIYIIYPDEQRIVIDENECLKSYFHDNQHTQTIGETFRYQE